MARKNSDGGHSYSRTARVNGRGGEWAVIVQGRDHTRVARIGPDGRADPSSEELVPSGDVSDVKRSYLVQPDGRGTLTLPAELRKRYGITGEALLQVVEEADGFFTRTVRVVPVDAPEPADLDELLAGVTPATAHEEIDFGPAVGAEVV